MSDVAIKVENLSKRYRIGQRESYKALRDVISDAAASPFRRLRGALNGNGASANGSSLSTQYSASGSDQIWALDDVSFEVKRGEVVGIIGRNGAGKSTLLKILSRITKPTKGHAKIHGRVGSLLEVGTGFHPELTGRENIYLNAAILGMRKAEVEKKFDEIVAFAEVEKFIDTPVKRYSSGMYVRLAFAVAAHLETEILVVDEVLAVGDAQFQKKCLGKMGDVAKHGRTVLFVSHQMNQIRRLSQTVLWLNKSVAQIGDPARVVSAYESHMTERQYDSSQRPSEDDAAARFLSWHISESESEDLHTLTTLGQVTINFTVRVRTPLRKVRHGIALLTDTNQNLWGTAAIDLDLDPGIHVFSHTVPSLMFQPGVYFWQVSVYDTNGAIDLWDCVPAMIISTQPQTHYRDEYAGLLNMPNDFRISKVNPNENKLEEQFADSCNWERNII